MAGMKLRRCALALMTWYLMTPPVMRIPRYGSKPNPAAHFRYWTIRGTYPSLADCDRGAAALLKLINSHPENLPDAFSDLDPDVIGEVTRNLACVSSDDPQLK
jgi:hypothetical protein